jgi:phosphatidylglycerophosphate synthase
MTEEPVDRRPIAARELGAMKAIASWMARKGFSANGISVAGMVFGLLAGVCLFLTARMPEAARLLWIGGAVFVQLRLLANLFDGMVAIERGTASKVGELFNEVPDRVSDTAALVGLGYAAGGDVLFGYGAALAAMMTAYVRAVGKGAGAPNDFCGPMAKQQRMFLVTMVSIFCAAAPAAWQRIDFGCCAYGVPGAVLIVILAGSLVTVVRRLWRIGARLKGAA